MIKLNRIWILAFVLFIGAAVVRLYRYTEFVTFLGDQGRDALIVKRILTFEHFPAIGPPSSVGQVYLGPFYYYFISPFLFLFRFNPVGLAFAVTFVWLLAIAFIWWVLYKKFGAVFSLLFLTIISFSAPFIELSRFSWNPNLLPVFSFASFYFFYRWLKNKTWLFALLFGSFIAFTVQLHHLGLLLLPTFGLGYLLYLVPTFKPPKLIKQTLIALGGFLFFSIPLVIFDLKHNFLNTKNFITLFTEGKVASDGSYSARLFATIQKVIQHSFQITLNEQTSVIVFCIFLVLSYFALKKLKSRFLFLHFLNSFIYIITFAALGSERHMHYFGPVYMSIFLMVTSWVFLLTKKNLQILLAVIIGIVFIYINSQKYPYFTNPSNNQISYAKKIADSFKPYIKDQPIQIVAIPFTETHAHFRYFLELDGYTLLPEESPDQAEELYVLCFQECTPDNDPQWQIAAFANKKIESSWKIDRITIYKIVHGP